MAKNMQALQEALKGARNTPEASQAAAASRSAGLALNALVATVVAIAFAASWKPLV